MKKKKTRIDSTTESDHWTSLYWGVTSPLLWVPRVGKGSQFSIYMGTVQIIAGIILLLIQVLQIYQCLLIFNLGIIWNSLYTIFIESIKLHNKLQIV